MPYLFFSLVVVLLFTGGASAPDEWHQIPARLAAILVIACALISFRRAHLDYGREVLIFLLLALAVIACQLIPLPPGLWSALPGRDMFVPAFDLAGVDPVWRPLSLTPDRTLNSLLALLPAFAAATGLAVIDRSHDRTVLLVLICAVLVAVLVGIVQVSSERLYFYRVTNRGWAVGLFANRSHQAVLLATSFPLLAAWAAAKTENRQADQTRNVLAIVLAALIAAMLLATGSRAGLPLGLLGMAGACVILLRGRQVRSGGWRGQLKVIVPLVVVALAVATALIWGRDFALQRLLTEEVSDRWTLLPLQLSIAGDFLPLGSGMGSFDPVFRMYEPHEFLGPLYLNHAHNDFLQVVIEAGVPGALLIILFLGWFTMRAWRVWRVRGRAEGSPAVLLGRAGSIVILVLLCSSAVEFPLRTPLLSFIFVVAVMWLVASGGAATPRNGRLDSSQQSDNSRGSGPGLPK